MQYRGKQTDGNIFAIFVCIKYVNSVFDSGDKAAWGELKPEV